MNEELMKDWVKQVWDSLNFTCQLLVWDAYKSHIMDSVRHYVDTQTDTDNSFIPGGLATHLQLANVSWNKPFKMAYKVKYNEWMSTESKLYMAAGNMCPPSKVLCLDWARECWEALPIKIIQKSFRTCGICVNVDSTDNGERHCLKSGGVAVEASGAITTKTARFISDTGTQDSDQEDPFAGLEEDNWSTTNLF